MGQPLGLELGRGGATIGVGVGMGVGWGVGLGMGWGDRPRRVISLRFELKAACEQQQPDASRVGSVSDIGGEYSIPGTFSHPV